MGLGNILLSLLGGVFGALIITVIQWIKQCRTNKAKEKRIKEIMVQQLEVFENAFMEIIKTQANVYIPKKDRADSSNTLRGNNKKPLFINYGQTELALLDGYYQVYDRLFLGEIGSFDASNYPLTNLFFLYYRKNIATIKERREQGRIEGQNRTPQLQYDTSINWIKKCRAAIAELKK